MTRHESSGSDAAFHAQAAAAAVAGDRGGGPKHAAVVLVLGVVYAAVLVQVNRFAPEPYMDEIFHVPQTQKYCDGDFGAWDPKITTFPGLYIFATLYAHGAALLGAAFCSPAVLRSVNVVFAVGSAFLILKLRALAVPRDPNSTAHALMVVAFPVHFFFAFLFYTDSAATFFVLLMVYFAEKVDLLAYPSLRGSYVLSALSGAAAVLCRQTNIIWVAFVAGTIVVKCVELSHRNYIYGTTKQDARLGNSIVIRNSARRVLINFVVVVFTNLVSLVQLVWPFVVIALAFVAFLLKNGGIVVGDKSNHEASFHGAQLLYFVVVAASGFGVSLVAPSSVRKFADAVRRNAKDPEGLLFVASVVALVLLTIALFSPVHKFMRADNRHYTFYVWRKFFLKHALAKFLPASLYLFFGWRCWTELQRNRTPLWALVYAIAVSLVLVPSPLVEPRYFLIPFILFHLNTGAQPALQLWTTTLAYALVNVITIYIFLAKPYTWVDGTVARFMW